MDWAGLFRDDIGEPGGAAVGSVGFFGSDVHGEGEKASFSQTSTVKRLVEPMKPASKTLRVFLTE